MLNNPYTNEQFTVCDCSPSINFIRIVIRVLQSKSLSVGKVLATKSSQRAKVEVCDDKKDSLFYRNVYV